MPGGLARAELAAQLAEQAVALGDDVVLVDRLEVLLARGDEAVAVQLREGCDHAREHLAHAVLDEARPAVRLFDDLDLVGALHQLVDLRGHARLGDRQQQRWRRSPRRSSSVQPICSVASPRWLCVATGTLLEDRARSARSLKPCSARRSRARAATSSCAHGQAVMPGGRDADDAPRAVLEGDRAAVQRVDLLGLHAGHRRGLVLGVARRDRHLGALGALARAHELGDVLGERLGAERRLAEHDLADRLVDDLLEARHVRALLAAVEIDEAVEAREEQLLADPHHLLDAGDADAREAERDRRERAPGRRRRARRAALKLEVGELACTAAKPSARRQPRAARGAATSRPPILVSLRT